MPVKRDADGNIVEQQTRVTDSPAPMKSAAAAPSPTPSPGGASDAYGAKTEIARKTESGERTGERKPAGEEKEAPTIIYRPGRPSIGAPPAPPATAPTAPGANMSAMSATSAMDDPPVGWLVVVAGPGQGNVLTLGNGVNSIGRNASERQSLDFGDEMISRAGHALLTYDPRHKKFYIQHGGGANLIYVDDDQPVLTLRELQSGEHIQIGNTTLRFVALCGELFDWDTGGAG
ncbi:MAG: FHA domain-containing protein [Gammaproteobacteria bacterium]